MKRWRNTRWSWRVPHTRRITSAWRWVLDMLIHTSSFNWHVCRSSVNYNACASVSVHARISSYLFFQPTFFFSEPSGTPQQNRSLRRGEDVRFAFDERRRCRNSRHSFARSRNAKWPRTWLACLHSGSRRLNDVGNEWDQSIHRVVSRFPDEENERSGEKQKISNMFSLIISDRLEKIFREYKKEIKNRNSLAMFLQVAMRR